MSLSICKSMSAYREWHHGQWPFRPVTCSCFWLWPASVLYLLCCIINVAVWHRWQFSVVVTRSSRSTRLTYAEPGWDGWPCPGSTPGGGTLFWYVTSQLGQLSLLLFMGRWNEYQPKGGDALWLRIKGRYGLFAGKTVCCHIWLLWKMLQYLKALHKYPGLLCCLWSPYGIGQTIIFSSCFFLLSSSSSSFFPRLISAVGNWMFTILWHMMWS